MAISFILNDETVNDQTSGLQTVDNIDDPFTDTDVAYSTLPAAFRTYLETTLGLSSTFPTNVGVATKTNSVTVDATGGTQLTGITFTDGAGGALTGDAATDDSGLDTVDGKNILLVADGDNTVIGKYDSDGNGSLDATAFVIFKEDNVNATATQAQVTFHIVTYTPVFHDDETDPDDAVDLGNNLKLAASERLELDFADLPSGQNLHGTIAVDKTDLSKGGLLLFPKGALLNADGSFTNASATTNTSQGGGAVTIGNSNQMFDPGEGHFFIYVDDPVATSVAGVLLNQNNADDADTIGFSGTLPQTTAQVEIVQVQGNDPASIKITAYDFTFGSAVNTNAEARDLVTDPLALNGTVSAPTSATEVNITQVRVLDGNGVEVTAGITINLAGNTAVITGLQDNYTVEWTAPGHDGVLIEGVAGKYDLGGFNIVNTGAFSEFVGQQIVIEDDGPAVSANLTAQLDDDALTGGNPGGTGDVDPDTANTSGTLGHAFGTDGAGSVAFLTTGAPAGFSYALSGNNLLINQDTTTVVTVTLNTATGAYTVTQNNPIVHAAGLAENNQEFTLNYRVTDGDSDTADGTLAINVDDDTPTASQAQQTGTVDEDGVPGGIAGGIGDVAGEATVATGSVVPLFNTGADQPLTFSLDSVTSGLPSLTSGGVAVTYAVAGNTLTASAGGNTVFTFSLDGTTGAWTFTLVDQLDHPTLNGLPDDNTENDLAIDLSSILRATDFDSDTVAAAANALIVTVDDDTPTASQAQQAGTVDEDGVPGGIAGGIGDVAGEATVATGSVVPLFNTGADQPLTFSLDSVTSGLPSLTSGGVAVTYAVAGNTLTASAGGNTVFTFSLDGTTGAWTFTLVDQLDHPTLNGLPDDNTENDLAIDLSSILRATDFDSDTVAAAANALIVTVDDDTPTASQAQQAGTVDEDGVPGGIAGGIGDVAGEATVATGSVVPLFNTGADQPLTFSLDSVTSGLPSLTSGGVAVTYAVAGNTLTASAGGNTVFTFSLDGTTGAWTFTLVDQLDHPTLNGLPDDNTENDLAIDLSSILRATDFDSDTVAAAANALIVTVDDDTPTASQAQQAGTVDEDGVPGGIAGGIGDVAGEATVATGSVVPLFNTGADQPLTFSLDSVTSGLPSLTSGGVAVTYAVAGNTLTASAGGNTVFTFSLDGTTGAWTFTLVDQLDHPTLNGLPDDNTENDLAIDLSSILRATDFDSDTVAAAANALIVTVDDDTPTASQAQQAGTVDEDGVPGGIAGGIGDVAGEATVATGSVVPLFNTGADQPLTFSLDSVTSGLPSLTSGGVAVTYAVAGNTLTASAGGNTVFTFSLDGTTGAWTFTLVDQLDHPTLNGLPDDNTENDLAIDLSSILRATDFDSDTVAAAANALIVTVDDDTPTVAANNLVQLDDDALTGGNSGGTGDVDPDTANTSGTLGHSFGADSAGSIAFLTTGAPSGFSYELSGSNLLIKQGTTTVVTVTLDTATGAYAVTQNAPILHAAGLDENNQAFTLTYQVTDGDGDTADGTLAIDIANDDTPIIGGVGGQPPIANGLVDFTTINGSNQNDFGGTSTSSVTNSLNGSVGADQNDANNEASDGTKTYTFASATIASSPIAGLTSDISDDGTTAWFFTDGATGTAGQFDLGIDTLYFSNVLGQAGAGTYTFTVHQNPVPAFLELDFADLPSGQNLHGTIAVDKTDLSKGGLLLFPKGALLNADGSFTNASATTNTSQGGGAVTIGNSNQMFDPGEGHFFIYVDDPVATSVAGVLLNQNNADDADTIGFSGTLPQTTAQVEIVQVQGNDPASIKITAYDFTFGSAVNTNAEARDLVTDPLALNGTVSAPTSATEVNITRVRVLDGNSVEVEDSDGSTNSPGITINLTGNTAVITGLQDNYTVEWTAPGHDGVLIEEVAGKYDLGGFNLVVEQPTPDQQFDFTVNVTDFDNDVVTSNEFSVGVDGTLLGVNDNDNVLFV